MGVIFVANIMQLVKEQVKTIACYIARIIFSNLQNFKEPQCKVYYSLHRKEAHTWASQPGIPPCKHLWQAKHVLQWEESHANHGINFHSGCLASPFSRVRSVCILLHTIKRSLATISSTKYADIFLPVCAENSFSSYYANVTKFLHYLHPSWFYILFNLVSLLLLYVKIINIHDIPVISHQKNYMSFQKGKEMLDI